MSWHLAIRAQLQLCASQQPGLSPCATYTQPDLYGPLALRTPWPLAWTTAMCMDSASGIPIRTTSMVRYSKKGVQCFLDRWRATDSTLEVSLKFGHVSPSLATRVALMRCGLVAAPPPAEQSGGVLLCEGQRLTTDVRRYNTKRQTSFCLVPNIGLRSVYVLRRAEVLPEALTLFPRRGFRMAPPLAVGPVRRLPTPLRSPGSAPWLPGFV